LNNVVQQYFNQPISSAFRPSTVLADAIPSQVTQQSTEQLITAMNQQNKFQGYDLTQSVFCFICPSGTTLTDNGTVTSLTGLGGYHGAVTAGSSTIYYAIVVYSENLNGQQNGLVVFDQPWKNVTASLYHELNEARTDANVTGTPGWISQQIGDFNNQQVEIGDTPVYEAGNQLQLIFKEVPLTDGSGTVPIQLLYSNAVHGPEGPRSTPAPMVSGAPSGSGGSTNWVAILLVLIVLVAIGVGVYFIFLHK